MPEEDNIHEINTLKIIGQFRRLWSYLRRNRKNQLIFLLIIQIFSASFDTIPIFLIGPLTRILTSNGSDDYFTNQLQFLNNIDPIFFLIVFISIIILSSILKLFNIYLSTRIAALVGNDISNIIYLKTLSQPYFVHLERNSSEIIAALSVQLNMVVGNLLRFFQFISSSINSLFIVSTLILINWKINLMILFSIFILYFLVAKYTKNKLRRNSNIIANRLKVQVKEVKESLSSILDIIIYNSQKYFRTNFNVIDRELRFAKAENNFLALVPRYLIEAFGISLLIFTLLFLKIINSDYNLIQILATLAFGSQKLLPELQKAYQAWAKFFSVGRTFEIILQLISQNYTKPYISKSNKTIKEFTKISFKKVCFGYHKQDKYLEFISDLNFSIIKGERIGIVGKTGSGKTTIANLMMGVLEPKSGEIFVNNKNMYENNNKDILFEWRNLISCVPQDPYLLDKSIAENIAFGQTKNDIDLKQVEAAAKKACVADFIKSLPNKYLTIVGENGARLSGGQKQRIAIARALFRNSKFIVLDEATSALDSDTESSILDVIYQLDREVTLILLAHRLSTLKQCTRVIEIKGNATFEISDIKDFFKKIKN